MCGLSQASCETGNVNYQRTLSGLERVFDSFVFHKLRMHCVKAVVRKQIPMGFQKKWEGWNRVARWESRGATAKPLFYPRSVCNDS